MRHDQDLETWLDVFAGIFADLGVSEVAVLSACVAHVDLPEQEQELTAALLDRGWAPRVLVRNDVFAVLRAGVIGLTERRPLVAVVCGSGINCAGVGVDGALARFLALGTDSGDWGGGYDIGRSGLWSACRAEDGRGRPTVLQSWFPARFGHARMREVALALYRGAITDDDVRSCAREVLRAAAEGDAVAEKIIQRQAAEIVAMISAALGSLDEAGQPATVVLGGSIAVNCPLLVRQVVAGLAENCTVVLSADPPVLGAALIGLDEFGPIPAAVERALANNLRAADRDAHSPAVR